MEGSNLYKGKLSILDYCVFISVLVISFSIGVFNGFKGKKTDEDFFVAGRSFGFLPVGMSLVVSVTSAIAILGMTGEAYSEGIQFLSFFIGTSFGIVTASFTTVTVYYGLNIVSVNEYIGMRFQSMLLRKLTMVVGLVTKLFYMGVVLYAPTLALSTVTQLDPSVCIYAVGIVCTLYSSFGGMRGVIWTDVFQLLVMTVGLSAVIIITFLKVGGFLEFWTIAKEGGRMSLFNMNISLYERHNFLNCFFFGFLLNGGFFSTNQDVVQRLSSVKSPKDMKRVMWFCAVAYLVAYSGLLICGAAIYVYYNGCDPLTLGVISKQDQILPLFIMETTSFLSGFPGLFVGLLLAATLSSLSSVINGIVAMFWKDFLQDIHFFRKMKPEKAQFTTRIISIFIGLLMIVMAFLSSKSGGLNQYIYTLMGAMNGPIHGVFYLGFFFPKCGSRGAIVGFVGSVVLVSWVSLGATMCASGSGGSHLPLSVHMCTNTSLFPGTSSLPPVEYLQASTHCEMFMPLYRISYTLYVVIGIFSCLFFGLVYTKIAGRDKNAKVAKEHVSSIIWRFYLDELTESETKNVDQKKDGDQLT